MAIKRIKKVGLWGAYYEDVWYDGPDDHYLVVARTEDKVVITFEHDGAPGKLREWLYRKLYKGAGDYDLELTRKGDRLYVALDQVRMLVRLVKSVSRLVRISEGAKELLHETEAAEEKADLEGARAFRAELRKQGFGRS